MKEKSCFKNLQVDIGTHKWVTQENELNFEILNT